LADGTFHDSLPGIPVEYNIQMELLKELADERYLAGVFSKRYLECFSHFLKGVQYTAEQKWRKLERDIMSIIKNTMSRS
jgi:lysine-N-methylase